MLQLLIASEYAQNDLDYWKEISTSPFLMSLGIDNFKRVNAHVDGSTGTSSVPANTDTIEQYVLIFFVFVSFTN